MLLKGTEGNPGPEGGEETKKRKILAPNEKKTCIITLKNCMKRNNKQNIQTENTVKSRARHVCRGKENTLGSWEEMGLMKCNSNF